MAEISSEVEDLLNDFSNNNPELSRIISELRNKVTNTSSELEESVKYGGLVFLKDGELLGGIFLRKAFVTMEFSFGNELSDEDGLLEGTGKLRRNLKFRDLLDIESKRAEFFINQAYG